MVNSNVTSLGANPDTGLAVNAPAGGRSCTSVNPCCVRVVSPPGPSSVTDARYVPAVSYTCVGAASVLRLPSPKSHA